MRRRRGIVSWTIVIVLQIIYKKKSVGKYTCIVIICNVLGAIVIATEYNKVYYTIICMPMSQYVAWPEFKETRTAGRTGALAVLNYMFE